MKTTFRTLLPLLLLFQTGTSLGLTSSNLKPFDETKKEYILTLKNGDKNVVLLEDSRLRVYFNYYRASIVGRLHIKNESTLNVDGAQIPLDQIRKIKTYNTGSLISGYTFLGMGLTAITGSVYVGYLWSQSDNLYSFLLFGAGTAVFAIAGCVLTPLGIGILTGPANNNYNSNKWSMKIEEIE